MGEIMKDWTAEEKKSITDLLKHIPAADRPSIRNAVKDMQADEAISYIKGMQAPEKPFKPSKASEGTYTPIQTKTSQNKPVKVSASGVGERLERVQGEIDIDNLDDSIKDKIISYIKSWCISNDIDDLRKVEQPVYNALCADIGKDIFKTPKILKDNTLRDVGSAALTNNNRYNLHKLAQAIDLYSYFSDLYNKVFTIWGAAAFCGVRKDTLYDNMEKLTLLNTDLHQKSELSLADSIVAGRRNPTGALAQLNHFYLWASAGSGHTTTKETTVIYPVLVDINKSDRETIPDKQSQ